MTDERSAQLPQGDLDAPVSPAVGPPSGWHLPAPDALDLDDLLAEIRARAQGATRSQERLSELLDAVVAIGSDLDLPTVLSRIVESACVVVGARYGALGVLDTTGSGLSEFITHGLDTQERAEVGHPPLGRGILGVVIRDARTLRLERLEDHRESVGLPPGHPPMTTFVGTPVRLRDHVFGNLYLAEKIDGQPFGKQDEAMLEGLAAAAGIAIDNAQLYRRTVAREQWAQAVAELRQTLLENGHERPALASMVRRARTLSGATVGLLATRGEDGVLTVRSVDSDSASARPEGALGTRLEADAWSRPLRQREPVLLLTRQDDVGAEDISTPLRRRLGLDAAGAGVLIPMTLGAVEVGLMALFWPPGGEAQAREAVDPLAGYGEQMALAIEAAQAGRQRSRARLLEERDRIARDMHDHVIQRLYAAGLTLQATSRRCEDQRAAQRIESVVDELDLAVKDLRSAISDLHRQPPQGGLGPQIDQILARAADGGGFVPDLVVEGALAEVPAHLEQDVVAVIREGLSNVVRHADAGAAQVHISVRDCVIVTICDDGVGINPADAARRGLVNLGDRAAAHGGSFSVSGRVPRGTQLRWHVPLLNARAKSDRGL